MSGRIHDSVSGRIVRLIVACLVAGGLTAACGTSSTGSPGAQASSPAATATASARGCLVGSSWIAIGGHIDWEVPTLEQEIPAAGAEYRELDAKGVDQDQADQIDQLVAAGARVIIVEPGDESAYLPAVQRAIKAGVAVISIWQPIQHAAALYVAFDPVELGRQEARAMLAAKPRGTYAVIKGDPHQVESELIAAGIREILQPAADRGDIKIVATVDTPGWDPNLAQQEMATILRQNGGIVDAVVAEDDGWGVMQALEAAGLSGKVAVAASTGNGSPVGLYNVALGTQTVEVWQNLERTAHAVAQAAIALCRDPDITKVAGSASVTWPGRDPMRAILLSPVAITKDNISIVLQTSPQWREKICTGYGNDPGAPPVPPVCPSGPVPSASASAQSQA